MKNNKLVANNNKTHEMLISVFPSLEANLTIKYFKNQ